MRKSALFLTFFVLTLFVNAQDKMGFGNDIEGADSAGFGMVTTWVKPAGEITYTGTLTVGYNEDLELYGYAPDWGSISPATSLIDAINWWRYDVEGCGYPGLALYANVTSLISLKINSNTYTVFDDQNPLFIVCNVSNPFPAVGQTCSIELKYTLP